MSTKTIKIQEGTGDGFFELSQTYPTGVYLIRAYTAWNRNFGNDFFFKEYIRVFDSFNEGKTNPISNVKLLQQNDGERKLVADLDPYIIDSLHRKNLTLFISLDNKKDTLLIKKGKENRYRVEFSIPGECQLVTMQMQTNNYLHYGKTIAVDENVLDLQFFPESGELVQGISSKIGFKALDFSGKGKRVEGEIVNEKGEVITFFKSNALGMGSFTLLNPDNNQLYYAKVKSPSEENFVMKYKLPEVVQVGNVLTVSRKGSYLHLMASSNYLINDSIFIRASCRGVDYYGIKGKLKDGVLSFFLPTNKLPEGVIAFTLRDNNRQPVAERLFFNERLDQRVNIEITSDKKSYVQREQTVLNIKTTDDIGKLVNTDMSLLVLNNEQMGELENTGQNILSYFLVSSDLRGEVENPGYYFDLSISNDERLKGLDALMLTQGWSKYKYSKPETRINFQPERNLTVSGMVTGSLNKKKRKISELTLMTFGEYPSAQSQITDSLGRFRFNLEDAYGPNLNILIQSATNRGKRQNFTVTLDKKGSPEISYDRRKSVEKADSVIIKLVEKNIERKSVEESFRLSSDIILDEVIIEDYRITPEREKVTKEYGRPDEIISGQSIRENEEKWSYGLYSVLLFSFPDKIRITQTRDFLYAHCHNPEVTLVVIDGIPVMSESYPLIPDIPPSEVKSFEIIEYAEKFAKLYMTVFPEVHPLDVPRLGNVIAIYTYAGKGLHGVSKPVGLRKKSVPVFSALREFYAPKYERISPEDWIKPDLRSIVHWEPNIKTDSLGGVSLSFYNSDNLGEILVVVEAISDEGDIGYQKYVYNVKKKNQ
ncbi:hypothetical protein QQ020_23560 [Fulvivirgaceae bacterium BMA12]|uniref:TonB-dependent receptor n=1 Tax=Agaribacillus aureus TaxID=3051825 RepID=A0ABT8LBD1_9BACT|nr:hypothetical protein [Fulvivirgaceae bacterium BMA12]